MKVLGYVLRWLMVPLSAAAVIAAAVLAARLAVSVADRRCPVDSMIGGACVAPWHTNVVEAAIYAAVAAAALGLVALPPMVAPGGKRSVAVIGFLLVAVLAAAVRVRFAWNGLLLASAIAAGCAAAALVWSWSRSHAR